MVFLVRTILPRLSPLRTFSLLRFVLVRGHPDLKQLICSDPRQNQTICVATIIVLLLDVAEDDLREQAAAHYRAPNPTISKLDKLMNQ
jgi:hypothetical protein